MDRLVARFGAGFGKLVGAVMLLGSGAIAAQASAPPPDLQAECEVLVVGGGLAGAATAYESLQSGRTVCVTELTDWVGGQLSAQGTSALDEARQQRALLFYAQGYNELRQRIADYYGTLNPGDCWVSVSCFLPDDAHEILMQQLADAAERGGGEFKWFPNTVVKELAYSEDGRQIVGAIAIQHQPAPGAPPLNSEPLSATLKDAYRYEDSDRFSKTIIQFGPQSQDSAGPADWYVVEATETGELIALADVPYRLGLDPKSFLNPSSPVRTPDPYCTQGFTYTFAMAQTAEAQPQPMPDFYPQYAPYFSYERERPEGNYFDFVFTYRRILSPFPRSDQRIFGVSRPKPGDISMQNWTWGNDYRPGTASDNLIYTRDQLQAQGQLTPGGWLGGLRTDTLRRGEENALSYYYWLVMGDTDSQLGDGVKQPQPNHRYIIGHDGPMGTAHGLSKFPYMREGRRIIGRPSVSHPQGFSIDEIDISWVDYGQEYYQETLSPREYRQLRLALAGLEAGQAVENELPSTEIPRRTRSTIYPDAVGIAQYAIDFHPCMAEAPPEAPGNIERPGLRRAHGQAYPGQIPLRAMVPQRIDNLLVASKSIATSYVAAAAYRVHSFEWSVGVAAGATIDYALERGIMPYQLIEDIPSQAPRLDELQQRIQARGNPTAFPNTSIFNLDWLEWRVW
jgi:hypothetical protein